MDDTVRIKHRNHFENKVLAKFASSVIIRHQELKDTINNVRGHGLTRMHTATYHNEGLFNCVVGVVLSNSENIDSISC